MSSLLKYLVPFAVLGRVQAASQLQDVNYFGPIYDTSLSMQVYVPETLPKHPSIVLALHGCGNSGQSYFDDTDFSPLADKHGAILIFPSSNKDFNCWDVATPQSLSHDGHGDSEVLANMIDTVIDRYDANPDKVFVTGSSSGCMMANVLAATYPDRLTAVSCYSGVPAGCMAGSPASNPFTGDRTCPNGGVVRTGEQWAERTRSMYPDYQGRYPRFLIWHGTADSLVLYQNFIEELKLWSHLHDVSHNTNLTDFPEQSYTTIVYGDGSGLVGVSAKGVGHVVPQHEHADFRFFGFGDDVGEL